MYSILLLLISVFFSIKILMLISWVISSVIAGNRQVSIEQSKPLRREDNEIYTG